jgi:hypothetical protein
MHSGFMSNPTHLGPRRHHSETPDVLDEARLLLKQLYWEAGRAPDPELIIEEDDHRRVEVPGAKRRELPLASPVPARDHARFHLESLAGHIELSGGDPEPDRSGSQRDGARDREAQVAELESRLRELS